jgi:flavin-dependent dehydrogenase
VSRPADADVVVVGAGPAGATTALLLARRGHRVALVDRARFPRPKPCGEYLNPGAVDVLRRIGCWRAVAPSGSTLSGMYITAPGTAFWTPFPAGQGGLVPRERLDAAIVCEAARAGAEVIEGCRVDAASPGSPPAVVGRVGGRSVRLVARLVVGADGLHSIAAPRVSGPAIARSAHYTVGAHFEGLAVLEPRGDLHLADGWYAGAAHYGGGIGNIVAALPRAVLRGARGDIEGAFARATAALPGLRAAMHGARRTTPLVCAGPLGYIRHRAVADGLLLVGDAAAAINPMTGEGLYMALRGAELAADAADRALRRGMASRQALRAYERARTAAFGHIWATSRLFQWIIRRPHLARPLVQRLAGHPRLATSLLGVVGDLRPV